MLAKVGLLLTLLGGAAALAGAIWNAVPHPDANIGAGLLVVVGVPTAAVGVLLLVIGLAFRARRPRA